MLFRETLTSACFTFATLMAVASVITVTKGAPGEIRRPDVATRNVNDAAARLNCVALNKNDKQKQNDQCPSETSYMVYNNRCLKLYTITRDYPTAKKQCEADKAHLFDMKSPGDDVEALKLLLKTAGQQLSPNDVSDGLWVGGNDIATEGSYQWSDSKPLSRDFKLWGKNEPDNYLQNEDCVEVVKTDVFELNDYDCSHELRSVCQIDIKTQ